MGEGGVTILDPCLDHVEPGEPFFVLRGHDSIAPQVVDEWARAVRRAYEAAGLPLIGPVLDKIDHAVGLAEAMRVWPNRKLPD